MGVPQPWELPDALIRYLADAELTVISWDGAAGTLLLRVRKEIGPEDGWLTFRGVTHVHLRPAMHISGIEVGGLDDLPTGFLETSRLGDQRLDADERVYLVHESWGGEFFVIAKAVDYQIR